MKMQTIGMRVAGATGHSGAGTRRARGRFLRHPARFLLCARLTEAAPNWTGPSNSFEVFLEAARSPLDSPCAALALARTGRPEDAVKAAEIWKKSGMPHATELLGQVALTLEAQTRPWPEANPGLDLPWPAGLPPRETFIDRPEAPIEPSPCDNLTPSRATKKLGWGGRKKVDRLVNRIEGRLSKGQAAEGLAMAAEAFGRGEESPELQVIAGIAADELGDPARARAHLARGLDLEPALLVARTHLARVYWRCGWFDLAIALWRSLPVEGPTIMGGIITWRSVTMRRTPGGSRGVDGGGVGRIFLRHATLLHRAGAASLAGPTRGENRSKMTAAHLFCWSGKCLFGLIR